MCLVLLTQSFVNTTTSAYDMLLSLTHATMRSRIPEVTKSNLRRHGMGSRLWVASSSRR